MTGSLAIVLLLAWAAPAFGQDFQCNECHSKNPKLVRMHEAAGYKDCMLCHDPSNFKFGAAGASDTPTPEQKKRMATDPVCTRCHAKQGN